MIRGNQQNAGLPQHDPVALLPGEDFQAVGSERESIWMVLQDRLAGRWLWMFLTALLLSGGLAVFGWYSGQQSYRSNGAVRIEPQVSKTLYETDEQVIPYYSQFVATQQQLIQSRRVLENAMEDPALANHPWAQQPGALSDLEDNLVVEADRFSQLLQVSFDSPDPELAQLVVDAVMSAYFEIYGQAGGKDLIDKLKRLESLEAELNRQLHAVRADMRRIIVKYENTDLLELHRMKQERLREIEDHVVFAQLALERLEGNEEAQQPVEGMLTTRMLNRLVEFDPVLGQLHLANNQAQANFETVKLKYRPGTMMYDEAERTAAAAERLFLAQLAATREAFEQMGETIPGAPIEGYGALSVEGLREEIARLQEQAATTRDEARQILGDIDEVEDLRIDEQRIQDDIAQATQRYQQLEFERQSIAGRVSIAQEATRPLDIYDDTRKKRAVFLGAFGLAAVFGGFFLVGTFDRRTYGASQLRAAHSLAAPPCLGVLPDLNRGISDEDTHDVASHCVHQIRNQIEALRAPTDGYVLAISSPFQGDGKTSIVLSLGWSYAAAGYRTVVVDCDLVGRSLTRQLGLVGAGGVKDAIANGHVNGDISHLQIRDLSALPVGMHASVGPESLRRRDLDQLFAELRERFDIVLVDTGPLLGSLESTPVTAAADGVVLTVRRGRSRTRLEECFTKLQAVGANCIGTVLNCAHRTECYRYVSEASLAAREVERTEHGDATDPERSLVRTSSGERNVLVLAMESTSRHRELQDEEGDARASRNGA